MDTAHSYSHAHGMHDFHKIKTAVGKFSQTVIGTIKAVKLKDVPQNIIQVDSPYATIFLYQIQLN